MRLLGALIVALMLLLPAPARAQSVKPEDLIGMWVHVGGFYGLTDSIKDEAVLAWLADTMGQKANKGFIPILIVQPRGKFNFTVNRDYLKNKSNLTFAPWDSLTRDTVFFGSGETYLVTFENKQLKLTPDLAPQGPWRAGFYRRIELPKPPARSRSAAKPRKK